MTTSWKIFTRDFKRLARVPKVWVIIIGVMITPALYSWFNINAFWDPYGNTGNIDVAVVNQDKGADSGITGRINVGKLVVDELKENDQLGWQFMDADEAEDALMKGDVFSSIVIPDQFSADFISMFEGTYSQPTLKYHPNEKLNAVSPKITDQGATQLDSRITSTFKEKVADVATKELRRTGGQLTHRLDGAQGDAADAFANTSQTLASGQERLGKLQTKIEGGRPAIGTVQDVLRQSDKTLEDAKGTLSQLQKTMDSVQKQVANFSDSATSALVDGSGAIAEGVASANSTAGTVAAQLDSVDQRVAAATNNAKGLLSQGDAAISQLRGLLDDSAVSPDATKQINDAIKDLQERNNTNHEVINDLDSLRGNAANTSKSVKAATEALQQATAEIHQAAEGLRSSVSGTVPKLNRAIGRLSASAGELSGALGSQQNMLRQSVGILDGVDQQLGATTDVLENFKEDLASMEDGVKTARTDILALGRAANAEPLKTVNNLDSVGVSRFMANPTELENHAVFPVGTYGSGMAALFTNLSMWIGAFMLMVIFRVEVDKKGLRRVTVGQAYRGRFMLLAALSVMQSLVVSIGDLVIGVQTINAPMFVLTCVLVGLTYLAIIYGLVAALGHIGRGIAVVLVFVQIPGASGLYPIEMTPDFFRLIYPLLPFTYGINALRETIGGFYHTNYLQSMVTLAIMALAFFFGGKFIRRLLSNFNLVFNKQLGKTGLLANETVQVVGSGYRISDVIHAMQDRNDFQAELKGREVIAIEKLPRYMKMIVIFGLVSLVGLGVLSRLIPDEKAIVFGLCTLLVLLTFGAIMTLEYLRQSYLRALRLTRMKQSKLQEYAAKSSDSEAYSLSDTTDATAVSADEGYGRHSLDRPDTAMDNGQNPRDDG